MAKHPALWAEEVLNFSPDPWQWDYLESQSKRVVLNCSRQSGKSTITAIRALHEALHKPKSTIVIVSPGLRQSQELMLKFDDFSSSLKESPKPLEDNKLSCRLPNKSRVLALPGSEKTIRGISAVTLLIEDEASRVLDALYKSVRPMLAVSQGSFIQMSTPFGKRGHFYETWEKKRSPAGKWDWFEITADQCPRISPEFLAEEREELGDLWFQQEYYCKFIDMENQLFATDIIHAAQGDIDAWSF